MVSEKQTTSMKVQVKARKELNSYRFFGMYKNYSDAIFALAKKDKKYQEWKKRSEGK